jgi:solute carrier family 25 (mitochondrial citrate transporter), member 1
MLDAICAAIDLEFLKPRTHNDQVAYIRFNDKQGITNFNMSAATIQTPLPSPVLSPPVIQKDAKKRKTIVSPALSLFAGAVAGATEAAVTYPFEFCKTRAQLPTQPGAPKPTIVSILSKTASEDGVRAIYTGCSTLIVGTAFKAGVRFLTFDSIKKSLADENGNLTAMRGVVAGMGAGAVESIVAVTPTERIKTALIDDARGQRRFNGGIHAARVLVAEKGLGALYRGLVATTAKQSATSATRMGTYNILKETNKRWDIPINTLTTFANGAVAGTVAVYVSQPLDTIKTRAQSASGSGTLDAVSRIVRERGILGFWSGSTMRLGRLVLSGGIVFSVYEAVVGVFQKQD